jgi:hypothetical protein
MIGFFKFSRESLSVGDAAACGWSQAVQFVSGVGGSMKLALLRNVVKGLGGRHEHRGDGATASRFFLKYYKFLNHF